LLALEEGGAEGFGIKRKRGRDREYLVVKVSAGLQHGIGHRAIDHPGIEMAIAVVPGEKLAERALSRRRRSVDRDDHENSAPSERIIGMKSGKLVAMKAVSSTLTGLSDASPITSADIAMRWSMWVETTPPPGTWPLPSTMRSSPEISTFTPLTRSIAAVASRRSDSFTRSSFSPRMIVVPSA